MNSSETSADLRVGDADRDDATHLLQEHLTAGRLTHAEFDERVATALKARHQSELNALFVDLPGRRPGMILPRQLADALPPRLHERRRWVSIVGGAGLAVLAVSHLTHGGGHGHGMHGGPGGGPMARGGGRGDMMAQHHGLMGMPMLVMAIAAVIIVFLIVRRVRRAATSPRAEKATGTLTADQHRLIDEALAQGRRIEAIRIFRRATGVPILEAAAAISAWQRRRKG